MVVVQYSVYLGGVDIAGGVVFSVPVLYCISLKCPLKNPPCPRFTVECMYERKKITNKLGIMKMQ